MDKIEARKMLIRLEYLESRMAAILCKSSDPYKTQALCREELKQAQVQIQNIKNTLGKNHDMPRL